MDKKFIDLFFKTLAGGLIPILFWVNSQSVEIAVINGKLNQIEKRLDRLEADIKGLNNETDDMEKRIDSLTLIQKELGVTLRFVSDMVEEIRHAIKN